MMAQGEWQLALGPRPAVAVGTLRELGMSRVEIARYFGIALDALLDLEDEIAAADRERFDGGFDPAQRR